MVKTNFMGLHVLVKVVNLVLKVITRCIPFGVALGQDEKLHFVLIARLFEYFEKMKKQLGLNFLVVDLDDDVVLAQTARFGRTVPRHMFDFERARARHQVLVQIEAKAALEVGPTPQQTETRRRKLVVVLYDHHLAVARVRVHRVVGFVGAVTHANDLHD